MTQTDQIILYYVTDGQEHVEAGGNGEEGEGGDPERGVEEEEEVFRCQFCPSTFDRELGLYGHLNSHKAGSLNVKKDRQ